MIELENNKKEINKLCEPQIILTHTKKKKEEIWIPTVCQ